MPRVASSLDLTPNTLNLSLYAGDGVALRVTVAEPDNEPIPLTGSIAAQVRRRRLDATGTDFYADMTEADDGAVSLSLTGEQTAALLAGKEKFKGFWDVQWHPDDAEPVTLIQGEVALISDVTRP